MSERLCTPIASVVGGIASSSLCPDDMRCSLFSAESGVLVLCATACPSRLWFALREAFSVTVTLGSATDAANGSCDVVWSGGGALAVPSMLSF